MKCLTFLLGVALLCLAFAPERIKGEDDVTIRNKENFNEGANATKGSEAALSEDEIVLKKWRNIERVFKELTEEGIKFLFPYAQRLTGEVKLSPKCVKSFMKMIYGIKEMKQWAFRMIDASGKLPNGIFSGSMSSLGDYDGCLSIDAPGRNGFRGQYCSILLTPPLPKRIPFRKSEVTLPIFVNFSKPGSVAEESTRRIQYFYQLSLRTSACIPSTCSAEDIQSVIESILAFLELDFTVTVPPCEVLEPVVLSKDDIAVICVLSVIFLLVFVATVRDVVQIIFFKETLSKSEASSTAVRCLMCFSAYSNALQILKKDKSPSSIKFFHGMRVVTILWVLLNHTYFFFNIDLSSNLMNMRNFENEIAFQVTANGFPVVETFFFISAVLLAYTNAGKDISIFSSIFRRLWRLTPPFMLVIATSMLIPHMGSGPGWKETVVELIDKCKVNWWTNLLYINNFISRENMCFHWLWYIPVDTHLYIMALFVMVFYKNRPRLALGINTVFFIAGTVASAASHIYYKLQPTVIYDFSHMEDISYFLDHCFYRTYYHITTCCIGLCVGSYLATKPKLKIPMMYNIFGWLCSMLLGLLVVYGPYEWNRGNVPGLAVSTLYICTSKVAWALALSYVTIACFTGNGGVITSILSWGAFVPLSRLTYVAYIIHALFQWMDIGSTRVPAPMDHRTKVYKYVGTVGISYGFAFLVSLFFELPFMGLDKIMFPNRTKPKKELKPKTEEDAKFGMQFKYPEAPISTISIKKVENYGP